MDCIKQGKIPTRTFIIGFMNSHGQHVTVKASLDGEEYDQIFDLLSKKLGAEKFTICDERLFKIANAATIARFISKQV
jgi:hypothetical protein